MNELYTVSQFIINEFQTNPIVNTISYEKTSDIDLNKENIYPLVNIDYITTEDVDVQLNFTFQITVLQQRDIEDILINDKLFGSNMVDNLSETLSILTKFLSGIRHNHNDEDIDIVTVSTITPIKFSNKNLLDGQQVSITLSIENKSTC